MPIEIVTDKGMPINLVRFFNLDMKQFLIFTQNTDISDEQGHLTIHVSEINNADHIMGNVVSDADWENVKNIIKGIVNSNKNNQPLPVEDLDYNNLDGITIVGDRALKLMSNYVDLLKVNQPVFVKPVVENIITPSVEIPNNTNTNVFNNGFENMANVANTYNQQYVAENQATEPVPAQEVEAIFGGSAMPQAPATQGPNYEQLYNEQVELVNKLQSELSMYKEKIEMVKSIINN